MTIRQSRVAGRWEVTVYAGPDPLRAGRERRLSRVVHGTKSDARVAEAELLLEVRSGTIAPTGATLNDLLERWLLHIEARGRSPWTLRGYQAYIRRSIRPALGHVRLDKLAPAQLDAFYDALTASGLSPTTVRQAHAILSAALAQGEKWGIVNRNVARLASPPSLRAKPKPMPTLEQLRELVKLGDERDPQ
ncbi:MAG TPA: hypothetical protein VMV02_03325, partial [Acidimicrobiales bacterium]|nr:hypothetical protein [Acidimicrobiales bacterium]